MSTQEPLFGLADVVAGGLIGFLSAYAMARLEWREAARRSAREARLTLIQKIRVPMSIIYREIEANAGFYLNRNTVDRRLDALREDVYALLDEPLIEAFEKGYENLRGMGVHNSEASRREAAPHVQGMQKRLHELYRIETESRPNARADETDADLFP